MSADDWVRVVVDGVEGASAEAVLRTNEAAHQRGVRASDGAQHPPLQGGRALWEVSKGIRPNLRGVTNESKGFAQGGLRVVRFKGRRRGDKPSRFALMTISVPNNRPGLHKFLRDEAEERGVYYFHVDGEVEKNMDLNLGHWISGFVVDD